MAKLEDVLKKNDVKCFSCGRRTVLNKDNTYTSYGLYSINGRSIICRDCIKQVFAYYYETYESERKATYYACRKLDYAFDENSFEMAVTQYGDRPINDEGSFFGIYLSKLLSVGIKQGAGKLFDESDDPNFDQVHDINNIKTESENEIDRYLNEKLYSKKWTGAYSQSQLDYLNNYLSGLQKDNNIYTTNHMDYAKQICKISLEIQSEYDTSDPSAIKIEKLTNLFDKLSTSANFSEKSKGSESQTDNLSSIIDAVETEIWIDTLRDDSVLYNKDIYESLLDQTSNIEKSISGELFDTFDIGDDKEEDDREDLIKYENEGVGKEGDSLGNKV